MKAICINSKIASMGLFGMNYTVGLVYRVKLTKERNGYNIGDNTHTYKWYFSHKTFKQGFKLLA